MSNKRVVIYLLSGQEYINEARRSAESIKQYHDDLPCILCTPDVITDKYPFDEILKLPNRNHKFFYVDATRYWMIAANEIDADRFLLLDADTFALAPLDDFFTILNSFDFTGVHAVGRQTMVQRTDIPLSFPELHIGANSFVKNEKTLEFLANFYDIYASRADYFGNNDQGPLREALWTNKQIRVATMSPEYCFRFRWGGLVSGEVKLLHGHELGATFEGIAKAINSNTKIRIFNRRELA